MTYRNLSAVLVTVIAVLGSFLGAPTGYAQAQGVLYDDFSAKELDATKWIGFQVAPGSFNGSPLELTRKIRGGKGALSGKLELSHRMVGGLTESTGIESRNRLGLRAIPFLGTVANFAGVELDVLPLEFETGSCPSPTPLPTRVRAGFNHQMFNDPAVVGAGNTGNVGAIVELRRNSTFPDPPDVIRAIGIVYRCQDAACTGSLTTSNVVTLGPVVRGEEVRLKLLWQPEFNGVSFQKNDEAPQFISYVEPPFNINPSVDALSNPPKPAGFFFKTLEVVTLAPACAEQSTEADITALFDNIVVLPLVP